MWLSVKKPKWCNSYRVYECPALGGTLTMKSVLVDGTYNLDTRLVNSAC